MVLWGPSSVVFNVQCPFQVAVPQPPLLSKHNTIVFYNFCFVSLAELNWHPTCLLHDFCLPKLHSLSISPKLCCSVLLSSD